MDGEGRADVDAPLRTDCADAQAFAAGALRLRLEAQRKYAEELLDRLRQLAMDEKAGPVQVSATRELLEQVLGRPMAATMPAEQQDGDWVAVLAARSTELRQKLDRIAQSEAAAADPERTDG